MTKNSGLVLAALAVAGCSAAAPGRDELQGVVELHQRVLGFELPGKLATLKVTRGQAVHAGDLLASLDDALERPQRDAQAAEVAAAQAQLELVEAGARSEDIRAAEAQLRGAKSAETTFGETARRLRELRAAGADTPQQLDDAEGSLAHATADREAAEQRLAATRAGSRSQEVRAAQAKLDAARAGLALSDARLAAHQLHAPVDGVILDTHVESGEVVGAGGAVVTLGETTRPYVDLFVPQPDIDGVRIGQPAEVHLDADPGHVFSGAVEDIGQRTEFTPRFLFSPKERPNLVVRVRVALHDPQIQLHSGLPVMGQLLSGGPRP